MLSQRTGLVLLYDFTRNAKVGPTIITVVTLLAWGQCEPIPTLQWFCIYAALCGVIKVVVGTIYRIPSTTDHLSADHLGLQLYNGVGALHIPGIIWGGIITFNERAPFGGDNCSPSLFVTGFANAAIPIVFILGYAVMAMMGKAST